MTDRATIAGLHDVLAAATPVVELDRAVAHGMASGPAVGLLTANERERSLLRARAEVSR